MKGKFLQTSLLAWLILVLAGCASTQSYRHSSEFYSKTPEKGEVLKSVSIAPVLEEKILALDPERITQDDFENVLSKAPAPRIINIHGGIYPVYLMMTSFSQFLIGMDYPEEKVRNPKDGAYSCSCYFDSKKIAGLIAWYYEKEGLRPIVIGHSQGGMQTVKVLHELAGTFGKDVPVWNPLTGQTENRTAILDPLSGENLPVTQLKIPYASAVGAGGLTRVLPNQWSMTIKLRSVPDSVENFTGFSMGMDLLGGDLLGAGAVNRFFPNGHAQVRNVRLPLGYEHVTVPDTHHLVKDSDIKKWIHAYAPSEEPQLTGSFKSSTRNILWAADVWHDIKKSWCLELQRVIRQKRLLGV